MLTSFDFTYIHRLYNLLSNMSTWGVSLLKMEHVVCSTVYCLQYGGVLPMQFIVIKVFYFLLKYNF